jgi:integrase
MPKLTDRFLTSFKPEPGKKDRLTFDSECRGLGVRTTVSGTRTFIVQWRDPATSQKRREPLGVWGGITIDQARDAARARLGDVAKGIDPREARLAVRAKAEAARRETKLTLATLVDDWAALHLAARRPSYRTEAVRAIKHAFVDYLKRPANRLGRADVIAVHDRLVAGGKPAIAGRTMAYAAACYSWAEKRGKVVGNPFSRLPNAATAEARERVLTDEELGRVWSAAAKMAEPWGPLIQVLMLSLARRGEVAGMRWSELSSDLSIWTIPGTRMKRGQAHIVVLSEAARNALRAVTRVKGQDLVFSTTGITPVSGFTRVKRALDKAAGASGWRLHDFRRTGVSALAKMGIDSIIADLLLAHQPGKLSTVARTYQRHDFGTERKAALEAWAAHVLNAAGQNDGTNVVPIRAAG